MKNYKGYLLDLDGTIYHGTRVIPEAITFINELNKRGIPYLYLTNNSMVTAEGVADRLSGMGIPAKPEQVYTTSMATATYLADQKEKDKTFFAIGETGVFEAMNKEGFTYTENNPSYVVVGLDRQFTYEKLSIAARAIRNGATFVATNIDPALPTENGFLPGGGSIVASVTTASATKPTVIGKPERIIVEYALEKLGTSPEETIIVGDNLLTDIQAGVNAGIDSLLVLSGYSTKDDADKYEVSPTYIEESLLTWIQKMPS
ncbi:TIGR01457 family HAD-type hydrolase [Brevibacillus daliensis]|uniref:TIGR01457 family HAD-type hydrolase n=1 Tax=Brevibacillus daliensis TaxID=2892995 RepID=UPI001E58798E|nr:TIGR01457 family HAD-type hydrolase [Brevibacillus daliensis]